MDVLDVLEHSFLFGTFLIEPQELQHFSSSMKNIYTNPTGSGFLQKIVAISFCGGKCVAVRGSVFIQEDEHRTLQRTVIDSKTTVEVLNRFFPQIPTNIVTDALAYLEKCQHTHACHSHVS